MADQATEDTHEVSPSVQALIDKLRDQGVAEGQARADRIVAEAEQRARAIMDRARSDAEAVLAQARKEADALDKATKDALGVAARDALLDLKTTLLKRFAEDIQRLVAEKMETDEVLKQMILIVVGRGAEDSGTANMEQFEIQLPPTAIGLDELRRNPDELEKGSLTQFALSIAHDAFAKGVSFGVMPHDQGGMRIVSKDGGLSVELTDEVVTGILLEHLQPRFRALLEGIIK